MRRDPQFVRPSARRKQTNIKTFDGRLWQFLNSSFGLWLFSAVFLSGATWLYTKLTGEAESMKIRTNAISRLDQEITYRLSFGSPGMINLSLDEHQETAPNIAGINSAVERILGVPEKGQELFPEYRDRNLESLVRDLAIYLRPPQRDCVLQAAAQIRVLRLLYSNVEDADVVKEILPIQLSRISKVRWHVGDISFSGRAQRESLVNDYRFRELAITLSKESGDPIPVEIYKCPLDEE